MDFCFSAFFNDRVLSEKKKKSLKVKKCIKVNVQSKRGELQSSKVRDKGLQGVSSSLVNS